MGCEVFFSLNAWLAWWGLSAGGMRPRDSPLLPAPLLRPFRGAVGSSPSLQGDPLGPLGYLAMCSNRRCFGFRVCVQAFVHLGSALVPHLAFLEETFTHMNSPSSSIFKGFLSNQEWTLNFMQFPFDIYHNDDIVFFSIWLI